MTCVHCNQDADLVERGLCEPCADQPFIRARYRPKGRVCADCGEGAESCECSFIDGLLFGEERPSSGYRGLTGIINQEDT